MIAVTAAIAVIRKAKPHRGDTETRRKIG